MSNKIQHLREKKNSRCKSIARKTAVELNSPKIPNDFVEHYIDPTATLKAGISPNPIIDSCLAALRVKIDKQVIVYATKDISLSRKLPIRLNRIEEEWWSDPKQKGKISKRDSKLLDRLYDYGFSIQIPGTYVYRGQGSGPAYLTVHYGATNSERGMLRIEYNPGHLDREGFIELNKLLKKLLGKYKDTVLAEAHVTRIDVALDTLSNFMACDLFSYVVKHVSTFNKSDGDKHLETFGSRASNKFIREYDAVDKFPKEVREAFAEAKLFCRRLEIEFKNRKVSLSGLRYWLNAELTKAIKNIECYSIAVLPLDAHTVNTINHSMVVKGKSFNAALSAAAKKDKRRDDKALKSLKNSLFKVEIPALDLHILRTHLSNNFQLEMIERMVDPEAYQPLEKAGRIRVQTQTEAETILMQKLHDAEESSNT